MKKAEQNRLPSFQPLASSTSAVGALAVSLVGYGRRGEELLDALARMPDVHVTAVADIWPWRREMARKRMGALKSVVRLYETPDELISAEGDRLDAVIVATPDWMHANHVALCLRAGKHVYCEGELTDDVDKARRLVNFAREKRLLIQGGHQRRSNPRYIHAFDNVCRTSQALGRVTHAYTQWHRGVAPLRVVPPGFELSSEQLTRYGYDTMHQFLNWEWYRQYGWGGAVSQLGQKLDLLRWFWQAEPISVSALAGCDVLNRETPDTLMALFTLRLAATKECVRGYVQVLGTTSRGSNYEQFMGENAVLTLSEIAACGDSVQPEYERILMDREMRAKCWTPHVCAGLILPLRQPPELDKKQNSVPVVDSRASPNAPGWPLPIRLDKSVLQVHLENFVAAVRGETSLTDPAEQAFANLVAVEGTLRSAATLRPVDFDSRDFVA